MRAFIVFALFGSIAFAATLTKVRQDMDTLMMRKDESQNPRDKIRDAAGEVMHDATREAREDTLRIGKNDIENPRHKGENLRAGKVTREDLNRGQYQG